MPRAKKNAATGGSDSTASKPRAPSKKKGKKGEVPNGTDGFGTTSLADYVRTARLNLSDLEKEVGIMREMANAFKTVAAEKSERHHWMYRKRLFREATSLESMALMLEDGSIRGEFESIYDRFLEYAQAFLQDYGIRTSLTVEGDPTSDPSAESREVEARDPSSDAAVDLPSAAPPTLTPQERKLDEQLLHEFRCVWEMLPPPVRFQVQDRCVGCGELMRVRQNEGVLVCPFCGAEAPNLDAAAPLTAYGEEVELPAANPKRRVHFAEKQMAFQAREPHVIPLAVKNAVMGRLFNLGCRSISDVTYQKVAIAMRDLRLKDWYDHKMKIACEITGLSPPYLDPEDEARCKRFFDAIQEPYERHKPPGRINFICYNYCTFQFFRLLGLDELLPYFCLLKGPEKLDATEEVFEKICADLRWEFKSTKELMERGGYQEGVEYVVRPGVLPPGDRPPPPVENSESSASSQDAATSQDKKSTKPPRKKSRKT